MDSFNGSLSIGFLGQGAVSLLFFCVVNILTGLREELTGQFASHMDVNAVVYCDGDTTVAKDVQEKAADNIKRVIARVDEDWAAASSQSPYLIKETQETKTTWHPIGS